ncbi:R-spondin-2-like [Glandiceps talaboti]
MDFSGTLLFLFALCLQLVSSESKYRGVGTTRDCPRGCKTCSTFNGCITCRPRLFLLLHRSDMKQIGICTHACPIGYYGQRALDQPSRCYKCRSSDRCEECFSRNFCTRCQAPYFLCNGKCLDSCPDDMFPDEKTGECRWKVDCEVSTWSAWGMCLKMGKTCGFKRGLETRTREVNIQPSPYGKRCPTITESKQCRMKPRHCPDYPNSSEPKPIESDKKKDKKTEKISKEKKRRKKDKFKRRKRKKNKRSRRKKRNRRSERKREKIQKQTLTA